MDDKTLSDHVKLQGIPCTYKASIFHVAQDNSPFHDIYSTPSPCVTGQFHGFCALQVQKSASHYTEAARDEITLLNQITNGSPRDEHCVQLIDHFEHQGPNGKHVCMIFEVSFKS